MLTLGEAKRKAIVLSKRMGTRMCVVPLGNGAYEVMSEAKYDDSPNAEYAIAVYSHGRNVDA